MGLVSQKIENLLRKASMNNYAQNDLDLIKEAAIFADKKHAGQLRKSGEPYIIHPIATASFLIDWNMDIETIVAGLLHDVVEDTNTTLDEIERTFSKNVAILVKYVSKVSDFSKKNRSNATNISGEQDYIIQVFLSMSHDLRAMIIKLADRYHNMLTIHYLAPEKQKRIASETFNLYANIAGRLGMYELKTELLDSSFQVLNNEAYLETKKHIDALVSHNQNTWDEMILKISNILDSYEIDYKLSTRIKGVYSTFEKLKRNFNIKEIHDIFALRVVVNKPLVCYKVLGLIHLNFSYIKKTFTDYISSPKLNLYQSIHTTLNQDDTLMELQIRTEKMDLFANIGLAAHWYYKEAINGNKINSEIADTINNLLLSDFLQSNSLDVLTLQKTTRDILFDVLILNDNSWKIVNKNNTVLDIAYRFDHERFIYLTGILKNGELVTFDSLLEAGDTLKFQYSKNNQVMLRQSWVNYVTLGNIKSFIKRYIDEQAKHKINNISVFLEEIIKHLKTNWVGEQKALTIIRENFDLKSFDSFFNFIEYTKKDNLFFANLFHKSKKLRKDALNQVYYFYSKWLLKEAFLKPADGIIFHSLSMPRCCAKIPGYSLIGTINQYHLEVHNINCPILDIRKWKLIKIEWDYELIEKVQKRFKFKLNFKAQWSPSIGNNIVRIFSRFNISLSSINIHRSDQENSCSVDLVVYATNISSIRSLMQKLEQHIVILQKPNL